MVSAKETPGRSIRKSSSRRPVRPGTNAPLSEKMQASFFRTVLSRRVLIIVSTILAALIVTSGGLLWFKKVYSDPENVFWGMVDRSLSARSVTRQVKQQMPGGTSDELQQLSWNPEPRLRSIKQLNYTGQSTQLTIEAISTPTDDYQHYVSISAPPGPDGKVKDYSSVYNLWLRNGGSGIARGGSSQAIASAFFGAVLFGNLQQPQRAEVVELLREAYKVELSKVERQTEGGRQVYRYEVNLKFKNYAKAAQLYAKETNLPNASSINPDAYQNDTSFALIFSIDVASRQLRRVEYKTSQVTEDYSGYGIATDINLPSKTVSADELQKTINAISR